MKKAPVLEGEEERVSVVREKYPQPTTNPDPELEKIIQEAVSLLSVPMASINILDSEKEVCRACMGNFPKEGLRDISFCGHALVQEDALICEDTLKDERFADNPYVVGEPHVRFYAGMRLLDKESGLPVGVFCIKDTKPHVFSMKELGIFFDLAARAETQIQHNA